MSINETIPEEKSDRVNCKKGRWISQHLVIFSASEILQVVALEKHSGWLLIKWERVLFKFGEVSKLTGIINGRNGKKRVLNRDFHRPLVIKSVRKVTFGSWKTEWVIKVNLKRKNLSSSELTFIIVFNCEWPSLPSMFGMLHESWWQQTPGRWLGPRKNPFMSQMPISNPLVALHSTSSTQRPTSLCLFRQGSLARKSALLSLAKLIRNTSSRRKAQTELAIRLY